MKRINSHLLIVAFLAIAQFFFLSSPCRAENLESSVFEMAHFSNGVRLSGLDSLDGTYESFENSTKGKSKLSLTRTGLPFEYNQIESNLVYNVRGSKNGLRYGGVYTWSSPPYNSLLDIRPLSLEPLGGFFRVDLVEDIAFNSSNPNNIDAVGSCYVSLGSRSTLPISYPCADIAGTHIEYSLDESIDKTQSISTGSGAYGINTNKTVVGCAVVRGGAGGTSTSLLNNKAFIALNDAESKPLSHGSLNMGDNSCAYDINDSGIIVGHIGRAAVYWSNDGNLHTLYQDDNHSAVAKFIDEHGNIIVNVSGTSRFVQIYPASDYNSPILLQDQLVDQYGHKFSRSYAALSPGYVPDVQILQVYEYQPGVGFLARARLNSSESEVDVVLKSISGNRLARMKNNIKYRESSINNTNQYSELASDFVVWDILTQTWFIKTLHPDVRDPKGNVYKSATSRQWGLEGDIPVFNADFDNDEFMDLVVWRPATGNWHTCTSQSEYNCFDDGGSQFGLKGDIPLVGDMDADGIQDKVVYRPLLSSHGIIGQWYYSSSASSGSVISFQWGLPGDIPLTGNIHNSQSSDAIVYRPSVGTWFIRNPRTQEVTVRQFGSSNDHPMLMDVTGDDLDDLIIFRPENGTWYFCDTHDGEHCFQEGTFNPKILPVQWGLSGDIPVLTNFDGGITFRPGIYRPHAESANNSYSFSAWYIRNALSPVNDVTSWGLSFHIPSGLSEKAKLEALGCMISGM